MPSPQNYLLPLIVQICLMLKAVIAEDIQMEEQFVAGLRGEGKGCGR